MSARGGHAAAFGGSVPGFGSCYAVEHRSDRERHRLLRLKDLDTAMSYGGYKMLWSLDPVEKYV